MTCGECPFSFVCYSGNMGLGASGGIINLCHRCNVLTYFPTYTKLEEATAFRFACPQRTIQGLFNQPLDTITNFKDIIPDPLGKGKVFVESCFYCDPQAWNKKDPLMVRNLDSGTVHALR